MAILSILHLSDFHFSSKKKRDQDIIVNALVSDLSKICIGYRKPDLIVFSGDFVQAGGVDSHLEAYDAFLEKVTKATSCSEDRVFLVPGNHDLSREVVREESLFHNLWQDMAGENGEIDWLNAQYSDEETNERLNKKFAEFRDFEELISDNVNARKRVFDNIYATVDSFDAIGLDVVGLNTAVFSTGGLTGFESDHGRLGIPEYAFIDAFSATNENHFKLVVSHHPSSYLTEQSSKIFTSQISRHANAHLFGHMHDPQPSHTVALNGNYFASQAGAIFTSRRHAYNGYSLILIDRDEGHVETLLRSYFDDRKEFDAALDLTPNGRWWSSEEACKFFRDRADPVNVQLFREHLSSVALQLLEKREDGDESSGFNHHKFVAPPLVRTTIHDLSESEERKEIEQPIEFRDIVSGPSNLIIYARQEYGRTTLLHEMKHLTLEEAKSAIVPRLPSMINFAEIKSNKDSLRRKLHAAAEELPQDVKFETLLVDGYVEILIDDVIFTDKTRMKILRDFVNEFPKNRYIFSSPYHSAIQFSATVDPEMPLRFEFVELRELRRRELRTLLERDERCSDVERWLDRLQSEFVEINLPFTAANGTILIEILSEKYNFQPINRAVLMEQFVDSTLRKGSLEQSRRETFDYTNKTDLLSYIAMHMAQNNAYLLDKEGLRELTKAYVDKIGLDVDVDKVTQEFFETKIFVMKSDSAVAFRYKGVLEYFIALRMTTDPQFRAWVLHEDRYLSFVNEINFYAGKLRKDAELLEIVAQRHKEIMAAIFDEVGEVNLKRFETIEIPNDGTWEDADSLIAEILERPLTKEEKDLELEAEIPKDAEDRQEVFRPEAKAANDRLWLSLVLYSGLVKNLELMDDAVKREHLREVLRGWSTLLLLALSVAPTLSKQRKIRINGALYEFNAPHGMSDVTLLKNIVLKLPHVHVKIASGALGTDKLRRQLSEPALDEASDPIIFEFFKTGLIADLRLRGMVDAVSHYLRRVSDYPFLNRSFLEHLFEVRRLGRLDDRDVERLEKPIARAISHIQGGDARARARTESQQLQRFRRRRLLLKAKGDKN